jgi:hypothetical protein
MKFLRFLRRRATNRSLLTTLATAALFVGLTLFLSDAPLHAQISSPDPPPASPEASAIVPGMEPLVQARKSVGLFFQQSTNVVCAESVMQTIVGKNGKPAYREESKYDYQLQAVSAGDSLKLQESRDVRKQAFRDAARTLLITKGFATLLLIVHPKYESSYEFEPAGVENDGTATLVKYNFKPVPGASSPAALQLRGKNYPLPLSGSIWIDKSTGAITRLTAAVDSSLSDLGLREMQSDIHYALVQFHDPDEAYWMPVSATIDLETPLQHWRNVHRFTAYRRFRASIEIEGLKEQKK